MIALHCLRHVRTLVEQNTGVEPMTRAKLGVSRSVIKDDPWEWSLHGLRHPPEADTNGWYLWTGELQADPDSSCRRTRRTSWTDARIWVGY